MSLKLFYFDCETTGVHRVHDDIWQIAGMVEIDGKVIDAVNIKMKPRNIERMPAKLFDMFNTTKEEMMNYPSRESAFEKLLVFFSKHTDIETRKDSLIPVGHNAASFDMGFFKKFFDEEFKHKNVNWQFLLDYHCIDTMNLCALAALAGVFPDAADSLRLSESCKMMGIPFDENEAHDALYDVKKTRTLFKKFSDIITIDSIE
jgi:DNA polymerase III alpha subunit (gram-positive type)